MYSIDIPYLIYDLHAKTNIDKKNKYSRSK